MPSRRSRDPPMLPDHEYHPLEVVAVVDETADTRSFVLGIPPALEATFAYTPGQFCTFRATIDGEPVVRCYSTTSAAFSTPRRARCSQRSAPTPTSTSAARVPTWTPSKPD